MSISAGLLSALGMWHIFVRVGASFSPGRLMVGPSVDKTGEVLVGNAKPMGEGLAIRYWGPPPRGLRRPFGVSDVTSGYGYVALRYQRKRFTIRYEAGPFPAT
jgi:hypothetical protein